MDCHVVGRLAAANMGTGGAYTDISSNWTARNRPARWTPFQANLPSSADDSLPFTAVNSWPALRFTDPTFVCELPDGSERMAVVERPGRIVVFPKNSPRPSDVKILLDITDRTMQVPNGAEDGLLGLAFHPNFADPQSPQRRWLFVRYTANTIGRRTNRLSRFTVPPGSDFADSKSEAILIDLPEETMIHKGGAVAIGPDGFLYTTFGTDGSSLPNSHSQRIDEALWGGVLRIDVNCRGGDVSHQPLRQPSIGVTANYFIPNDNPFVRQPQAMEEFYSIGFRNPWRMTIDRQTGSVWVGDTGDRRREEIDICTPGSNHQWDYLEGTLPTSNYDSDAPHHPDQVIGIETPPVFEYKHAGLNHCVIGGYVYRGRKFPEISGKYVYADQCGRIYALAVDEDQKFVSNEMIAAIRDPGLGISSLGEDADGELYICWIDRLRAPSSPIYRLVRSIQRPDHQMPPTLSATGLFRDLKTLKPNAALIPYEVNSPLWSDRATKQRWIGFAASEKISGDLEGCWSFPAGTVFVKHFDLPLNEQETEGGSRRAEGGVGQNPSPVRRLETRVLLCDERGGVSGASYRWNEDETDAYLIDKSTTEEIEYVDRNGAPQTQTWFYPGRVDCTACHTAQAGGVLGFNARQLNRDANVGGLSENQMLRFAKAGMFGFDCSAEKLSRTIKLAAVDDTSASVEHRVRSYLDANCSHCHRPEGRYGLWDARIETPLAWQQIVNGNAITHRDKDTSALVVKPGDPEKSYLYLRMASTEDHLRMPALGRLVVHQEAVDLVRQWILSMCETSREAKPAASSEVTSQDH